MVRSVNGVAPERAAALGSALRLEYLTLGWNVAEAAVGIAAGLVAGSTALVGFGGDSVVESLSGAILMWRLSVERRGSAAGRAESVERRARRMVAVSMWVLAVYVASQSLVGLLAGEAAEASPVGIGLAVASLATMWLLARAKRARARDLHSHALEADAAQTEICWQLSALLLVGLGLNAAFGWWWADGVAAVGMAGLIANEGRLAWRERDCC
jgi:divalent metal cation (Fe/Co/Zn/Cd) transporter